MTTVMIFHEVDDVQHWVSSDKREEVLGPLGVTVRTFVDPEGTNSVGLVADIEDMDAFQAFLQSKAGGAAMQHDGVRPDTIRMLVAS